MNLWYSSHLPAALQGPAVPGTDLEDLQEDAGIFLGRKIHTEKQGSYTGIHTHTQTHTYKQSLSHTKIILQIHVCSCLVRTGKPVRGLLIQLNPLLMS